MTGSYNQIWVLIRSNLGVPIILLILLSMIILPVHPILLDLFFTFNITLSLLVLLAGIYTPRPLDFAVFPTVLLLTTLLRLALNVASTRVVLLNGQNGANAAGQVIHSFGDVVVGGNFAVGLVVFAILVIINFVVVTKGAGRISEVSARFTLDALPGKQMAIDADLNAGVIEQEEASRRREEVTQEADFYGSMDGASKFVRGDAIAGILILFINLIGGVAIGTLQYDMTFQEAAKIYALLTIGDGLVAQIPSLMLSIAAAMMVTRISKSHSMEKQLFKQVFSKTKSMLISAIILFSLGLIPGMPHVAFIGVALLIIISNIYIKYTTAQQELAKGQEDKTTNEEVNKVPKELDWDDVPPVDVLGLEIGYKLINLVDKEKTKSGDLMTRIKGVRKKLSQELGFLIPAVHIRDNLDLAPNSYRISILGVVSAEDKIYPEKELAINPGQVASKLDGIAVKDPSFGLEAFWINKEQRENAQTIGYTVVDPSTVIATHLSQVIQNHAYQLISHEEAQKILDILSNNSPKLVEDLVPKTISLGTFVKVLQNLLIEKVPIKDMRTIAETLTEVGQKNQEPDQLTVAVRKNLGSMIVQQINGFTKELPVATLSPSLEQLLHKSIQSAGEEGMMVEPSLADKLQNSLKAFSDNQEFSGQPSVLLSSSAIRLFLSKFIRSFIPSINVLAYQEIPVDRQIKIVSTIGD